MLLIVVLCLIAKLALVSSDCDIGTQKLNDFDMNKFAGTRPWHWLLHTRNELEGNLDCLVTTFADPDGDSTSVTSQAYDIKQQRYITFTGHAFNWNNTGFDLKIDQQSLWDGRVYVIAVDYDRYVILKLCSQESNKVLVYVGYRCTNPDTATLDEVKKDLKNNNIDGSQLVPWSAEHCQE